MAEKDTEAAKPATIPFLRQVYDMPGITHDVLNYEYEGAGTEDDPYVVDWIEDDPRNPLCWSETRKWAMTALVANALLAVAFASSAYSGGSNEIVMAFRCSQVVYSLGIALFVLGFALGPLLWAPLSEMFGRRIIFVVTFGILTAFQGGCIGANNITTLVVLRFFAGAFGASPLTNAGGVIADMFSSRERGLAMSLFGAAPFMGPVLGPPVGGFIGETVGWRWIMAVITIFCGVFFILITLCLPETYAPVILRKRAEVLSKRTGKVYKNRGDAEQGQITFSHVVKTSMARPWVLLFKEPIVLLLSIYMAIIYGTLYGLFGSYPIVYQEVRGWSPGIGGLPFLALMIGMIAAVAYNVVDNRRYAKAFDSNDGFALPETRMPPCLIGAVALPIGLIWFAWTNYPSIHWFASVAAGAPFGFGVVLVFVGIFNYLIDAYTIFSASVLAANTVLRSVVGAAFSLFVPFMYSGLGIHWATMIPGFLALACLPFPFLFYKYGAKVRERCKYAKESMDFMRKLREQQQDEDSDEDESSQAKGGRKQSRGVEEREAIEEEEIKDMSQKEEEIEDRQPKFEVMRPTKSRGLVKIRTYDANPFDLDRVNTAESFLWESRARRRTRGSSIASSRKQ